jgi:hypothetical protein
MTAFGPGIPTPQARFALAALAARLTAWTLAFLAVIVGVALVIGRGLEAGLGVATQVLPELLVNASFAYFLHRGSRIAAALFGLWCLWGLLKSIQGAEGAATALLVYAFGVLNFIGLAGVVKGFGKRNPACPPN